MKFGELPHAVLAKLIGMDAHLTALIAQAYEADSKLSYARHIINGKDNSISAEEFAQQRDGFDAVYNAANAARANAEVQRKVLSDARHWVEALPPDSRLLMVQPAVSDLDLATLQKKLSGLRNELRVLLGTPPVPDDIESKVRDYVGTLGRAAMPAVRGFAQGEVLRVNFSGDPFDAERGSAALLMATLFPDELSALIMKAIAKDQPLTVAAHAERRGALMHELDEVSYALAALLEKAEMPPDALMAPHHILGVRIEEAARGGVK